jgi:hypothetical protein
VKLLDASTYLGQASYPVPQWRAKPSRAYLLPQLPCGKQASLKAAVGRLLAYGIIAWTSLELVLSVPDPSMARTT